MKIGLYGGSFDPIHNGHIAVAQAAAKEKALSEVIFIPSGQSPHKSLCVPPVMRYEMAKLAIKGNPLFSVSDFETKKQTKCYSFETVTEFKKRYPSDELFFIIGDDEYAMFDTWYRAEELKKMCTFLVITRNGEKILPPFCGVKMPPVPISSRDIRTRIKNGDDTDGLIAPSVAEYIKRHGLYI